MGKSSAAVRTQTVIKVLPVDPQAISVRLQRDGITVHYIAPPRTDRLSIPTATLKQALHYCTSQSEISQHKCRAAPDSDLYAHEAAVFAGLVRLINSCMSSNIIKAELRRLADVRAREAEAEQQASDDDLPDAEPPHDDVPVEYDT